MRRIVTIVTVLAILGSSSISRPQEKEAAGLFVVIVNDKRGYIDRTGKVVIGPKYAGASSFSEGLANVAVSDGGYAEGYIDETGKIVIKPQFDKALAFSEGLALVGFDQTKREVQDGDETYVIHSLHPSYKWGYIDRTGRLVVEPKYSSAQSFSEGLAAVKESDGKYIFIDKAGQRALPQEFEAAGSFSEGLAPVLINGKFGFIDKSGSIILGPKFTSAGSFRGGLASVRIGGKQFTPGGLRIIGDLGGKYAYIDKAGNIIIRLSSEVDRAHSFSEGLAAVEMKSGGCGYIDKSGRMITGPKFSTCHAFSDGVALVIREGKFQYIDKNGNTIISTTYGMAWDFKDGLAFVQVGDDVRDAKYGYIDKTGKVVWQPSK